MARKRSSGKANPLVWIAVAVIALVGFGVIQNPLSVQDTSVSGPSGEAISAEQGVIDATLCANNINPTVGLNAVNSLETTSTEYISGTTLHVRRLINGVAQTSSQVNLALTGASEATDTTTAVCNAQYDIVVETQKDVVKRCSSSRPNNNRC